MHTPGGALIPKKILLTAILVLFAAPLSAQTLELPVEVPLTRVEYGEITGHDRPRVATDGTDFLAVWTDRRETYKDVVYAARFTAGGTLLDPLGIPIAEGFAADVLWTGSGYLVVANTPHGWAILSLDAEVNLRGRHSLAAYQFHGNNDITLATNGSNVLLVAGSGTAIRLDLGGKPLGSFSLGTGLLASGVSVASNGRDYLIAFLGARDVLALPVSSAGVPGTPAQISNEVFYSNVAVESDGDSYLIVWTARSVFAQRVNPSGVANGERRTLHTIPEPGVAMTPRLAWRNGEYIVTHALYLEVFETRTSSRGEPVAPPRAYAYGLAPDVIAGNGTAAFVWVERGGGIRAGVALSRDALDAIAVLSRGALAQGAPQLTRAENTVVAAWVERGEIRIAPLGGEPQIVAALTRAGDAELDVVFDGSIVWVVWREGPRFFVRRYTTSVVAVDATPLEFEARDTYFFEWSVAAGPGGLLIASRVNSNSAEIIATIVRATGATLSTTDVDLAIEPLEDRAPTAAWNGSEYVVAWIHQNEMPFWQLLQPVPEEIRAVRVTLEGARLDPMPLVVHQRNDPTYLSSLRAATANGGGVVLAWRDSGHTYATRFRGDELPPVKIIRESDEMLGAIVPLSSGYELLWSGTHGITMQRVSAELEQDGEPSRFQKAFSFSNATAIGNSLYLGYARPVHDPAFGGVSRAFVSHGVMGPRRRVVR